MKRITLDDVSGTPTKITKPKPILESNKEDITITAEEFKQLERMIYTYCDLSDVNIYIREHNYNFISTENYIIFNKYIEAVTRKLPITRIPTISQETIEELPRVAVNHVIALEGFIANLWEKIKTMFMKMYAKLTEFFKRYFTRLGRVKGRLENLKEVLGEVVGDLKQTSLDDIPGSLASKFPMDEDTLNISQIETVLNNSNALLKGLELFIGLAKTVAFNKIVDKDLVANIRKNIAQLEKLKEEEKKLKDQKDEKLAEKGPLGKLTNKAGLKSKDIKEIDTKLKDIANKKTDIDKETKDLDKSVGDSMGDMVVLDEPDNEKIKEDIARLKKIIVDTFEGIKNKPLAEGKFIKEIKMNDDGEIDVDIDTNKEKPKRVMLADKQELKGLVNTALEIVKYLDSNKNDYVGIVDSIYDKIKEVDKIISEINKIEDKISKDTEGSKEKVANVLKYKKLLNNHIKEKLNQFKDLFSYTSKFVTTITDITIVAAEGVADYTVLSLKYFEPKA